MTGVKGYIQDNLPPSWDKVLRDNRCLGSFITQFYNAIAKPKNRNKYYYTVSITTARHYLKTCSIDSIAIALEFKEGAKFWNEIGYQVKLYELIYE